MTRTRRLGRGVALGALWGLIVGAAAAQELPKPHADLPKEFKQFLARGEIPAVDDPEFVTVAEAEIPEDAWVLGVEIDGQSRAYSLNLLNHHEIVNDRIGGHNIAAVW